MLFGYVEFRTRGLEFCQWQLSPPLVGMGLPNGAKATQDAKKFRVGLSMYRDSRSLSSLNSSLSSVYRGLCSRAPVFLYHTHQLQHQSLTTSSTLSVAREPPLTCLTSTWRGWGWCRGVAIGLLVVSVECVMLSVTRAQPRTVEHVMPRSARAQPRTIFPSVRLFPGFVKFDSYNSRDSLNFVRT